jgi:putative ABC transport system permease protein
LAAVRTTVSAVVQGIPVTSVQIGAGLAVTGTLLGLAVSLAAAVLPLLEARRVPPVQNLLKERPVRIRRGAVARAFAGAAASLAAAAVLSRIPPISERPVTALLAALAVAAALLSLSPVLMDAAARAVGWLRLGPAVSTPPRLAGAALAAGRRRASWAAGAIGVSVAFSVAVGVFTHSFRTTVVDWADQGLRADVWVRPLSDDTGFQVGRLSPGVVQAAEALFGSGVVDPIHMAQARYAEEPVTLGAGEFPIARTRSGVPFRRGRTPAEVFGEALRVRGCVVNEPFALRFGVKEDDVIRLKLREGEFQRKVCGVFYDYSDQRGTVFINRADFLKLYPDDGPTGVFLFLPPGLDPSRARASLYRALSGRYQVEVLLSGDLRQEVVAAFDRTFAITKALQASTGAVAVLAVLAVLYALVDERRRDLALVRALGGSRIQVGAVVALQAGILGLVGALPGLAGGLLMGLLLVKVASLQSFHWTLRFIPPWGNLLTVLAGVVLACVAAGLTPALKAARSSPQEDLREDE